MTNLTIGSRPYAGENDLQPIADLLNLCDAVDKLDDNYSVNGLRLEFDEPNVDKARDIQLWENEQGQLMAFSQTYIRQSSPEDATVDGYLYIRIHPQHREVELEDAIMAWAEQRMCQVSQERGKPAELRSGEPQHYAYHFAMLERHGFAPARHFFRMARPLDMPIAEPRLPKGYTLRHVANSEDAERWVDAYNWSFIDHYNFHPRTLEAHQHSLSEPSYHAERDLIAVTDDGEIAAFAFCWIDAENNERNKREDGWVSMLGVRRGHRKIGLGKAMLLAGLQRLKADGMSTAKLGVDAENPTGALQLYESVGFTRDGVWWTWLKHTRDA